MPNFHTIWHNPPQLLAGISAAGLIIYLKYLNLRGAEDRKVHKADIQTLCDGKK